VIERALELLVQDLERRKLAATEHPRLPRRSRSVTRQVPAAVRREVWKRDGGQCAFVGTAGRCTERGFLELHHVIPFAEGGDASAGNIQLRCRAHNQHEATRWFGANIVRERTLVYGEPLTRSGPSSRVA
jgi:5-methylcytosine-specific restriction endonuclease McrA